MSAIYDAIIVGTGPAGLTAGLYLARAKMNILLLEKKIFGGELMDRDLIENYPGFAEGILGPDLGSSMLAQVMNYSPDIISDEVLEIQLEGNYRVVVTRTETYKTKAVILACGSKPKKLNVPGEEILYGKGVFYCATCDGPHFSNKIVAVIGGGDSGITEALFLSKITSKVIVLEITPYLNATKVLQERLYSNPKIEVKCGYQINSITGNQSVDGIEITEIQSGLKKHINVGGVLVHIGLDPNTKFVDTLLALNKRQQITVNEYMETSISGIFAAGDIRHNSVMQISSAVGDGATAAISLIKYAGTIS